MEVSRLVLTGPRMESKSRHMLGLGKLLCHFFETLKNNSTCKTIHKQFYDNLNHFVDSKPKKGISKYDQFKSRTLAFTPAKEQMDLDQKRSGLILL